MIDDARRIILFDGVCILCQRFVDFIIKHDPSAKIKFSAIQSERGIKLLKQAGFLHGQTEFIVYLREGECFSKSLAILELMSDLGGIWKLFYGFIILPKFLRDFFYDFLAKRRYWFFGRMDSCMIPSTENRIRFLE